MSVLESVRDYLRDIPGLEGLRLDGMDDQAGALCLVPDPAELVLRTYLDGATRRQACFALLLRWGAGAPDESGAAAHGALCALAEALEARTLAGNLPELGPGLRAWSLRASDAPETQLEQDNGLRVERLPLRLIYYKEG